MYLPGDSVIAAIIVCRNTIVVTGFEADLRDATNQAKATENERDSAKQEDVVAKEREEIVKHEVYDLKAKADFHCSMVTYFEADLHDATDWAKAAESKRDSAKQEAVAAKEREEIVKHEI